MSQLSAGFEFTTSVVTELLEQTECWSGGREIPPLPDANVVMTAVGNLRDLLFPGIHSPAFPVPAQRAEAAKKLHSIQQALTAEVGKALRHSQMALLRLHGATEAVQNEEPEHLVNRFIRRLPAVQRLLHADVEAAFENDPAAKTRDEIVLCYPGVEAICIYRLAHELLLAGVPYLPRLMTEWAHQKTGIDIHPGAKIGGSFFIDHGTGVVIGETCEIGAGVTLYQGVTLGAWSFPRDEDGNLIRGARRHPTLEDRVTVYSNATILGGTTVIGAGSQIGSSVSLNRSVPPNTIVTIERPSLRFRDAA